jgi:hypothetical protein
MRRRGYSIVMELAKSPFPGVDPFLEDQGLWDDFQLTFTVCLREALMRQLPPDHLARLDQPEALAGPTANAERTSPCHIHVLRRKDNYIVTVIKILSPEDKRGGGHAEYAAQRRDVLLGGAHLVELDLLIRGRRVELHGPLPAADYVVLITRRDRASICYVYPFSLRDSLPTIPVPLDLPDSDVALDLQDVFAVAFSRASYDRLLQYHRPLTLPLSEEQKKWVQQRVRDAGL